ncbi:hypothetical protein RAS1_21390 [Phycisphaerae bacterium RAS1]|nr:hypothetical protein RAS1_21390 [Phycisphaerae bacterium RAS1]
MSTHSKIAFSKICALACACLVVSVAYGATSFTFTANGGSSGDWTYAINWSPNGVPVSGDTATIPDGKTCVIEQANQPARR